MDIQGYMPNYLLSTIARNLLQKLHEPSNASQTKKKAQANNLQPFLPSVTITTHMPPQQRPHQPQPPTSTPRRQEPEPHHPEERPSEQLPSRLALPQH